MSSAPIPPAMTPPAMSPAEMHHHVAILLDRASLHDGSAPAECWLWVTARERAALAAIEASLAARLEMARGEGGRQPRPGRMRVPS